jgi:hypothetical protein
MFIKKILFIPTTFSKEETLEKLKAISDDWNDVNSKKYFLADFDENKFRLAPDQIFRGNKIRPVFTGFYNSNKKHVEFEVELEKSVKSSVLLRIVAVPFLFLFFFLFAKEFIISFQIYLFLVFYLISLIIMVVFYQVQMKKSIRRLKKALS